MLNGHRRSNMMGDSELRNAFMKREESNIVPQAFEGVDNGSH